MNDFKSLSERVVCKIMSYLNQKEGFDRVKGSTDEVTGHATMMIKDSFGYMYEVEVRLVGRTKLDRSDLK